MKIILGSRSPRRRELLTKLGYDFKVIVSNISEAEEGQAPEDMVMQNALKKAEQIAQDNPDDLVICADTIVVFEDAVLGKPKSPEHAKAMIELLQNNVHRVLTSVVCIYKNHIEKFTEETKVTVIPMTADQIDEYVNTTEPYDKAGAYAIQGIFAKFVSKIEGDYYNVMGLPICRLYQVIEDIKKKEI